MVLGYTRFMPDNMMLHDQDRLPLAQVAQRVGLSAGYLRAAAVRGELTARKDGRNWTTTLAAVRDFVAREPQTSRGQGQRRRWSVEKAYSVVREQLGAPEEDRAFSIPGDMLVPLSIRFFRQWMRDRQEMEGAFPTSPPDGDRSRYIEIPLGQLKSLKANEFVRKMPDLAAEMVASRQQGLELAIGGGNARQMVMTRDRYEQYLAVLRKHGHEDDSYHAVKGARDAHALLEEAPRLSTVYTIKAREGGSDEHPIELVVVPAALYDQLTRHLAWEIETWFRQKMENMDG